MTSDHGHESQERLPGEADILLLHPPDSKADQEGQAEKAAEEAYKKRQLDIAAAQTKISESNRDLTRWLAGFTFLGVVAGGIQAYFSHKGVEEAQHSAEAAQNAAYQACQANQVARNTLLQGQVEAADAHSATLAALYQARIAAASEVANVHLKGLLPNNFVVGEPLEVPVLFTNEGSAAALNWRVVMRAELLPRTAEPQLTYPLQQTTELDGPRLEKGEGSTSIGISHLTVSINDKNGSALTITPEVASDISKGLKDIVLYGKATYSDVFGVRHWTEACLSEVSAKKGDPVDPRMTHGRCGDYNKVDTNGPLNRLFQPVPKPPIQTLAPITCTPPEQR